LISEGECADFFLIHSKKGGSHVSRPQSAYPGCAAKSIVL
jgi:hypothetical protein